MTVRHSSDLVGFGRGGCFGGLRRSGVFAEDLDFAAIGVHAVSKRSTTVLLFEVSDLRVGSMAVAVCVRRWRVFRSGGFRDDLILVRTGHAEPADVSSP